VRAEAHRDDAADLEHDTGLNGLNKGLRQGGESYSLGNEVQSPPPPGATPMQETACSHRAWTVDGRHEADVIDMGRSWSMHC
jgi:hypothetical protein